MNSIEISNGKIYLEVTNEATAVLERITGNGPMVISFEPVGNKLVVELNGERLCFSVLH